MKRSNYHHARSGIDVGRIPAIAGHENFVGQFGFADRVANFRTEFQIAGALTNNGKPRVGPLPQNRLRGFDQNELAFIGTDHSDIDNQRRFQ